MFRCTAAAPASGESGAFVTATVSAPASAAADVDSTRSGEPPDWLTVTHSTSRKSGFAPYVVSVDGEANPAGRPSVVSTRYFA
jgi:hypothetical protein